MVNKIHIASEEAFNIRKRIIERDLEHCKSLTPEQVDTVIELSKECNENAQSTLFTIELETETSIPKVFYKGEEITGRIQINFDWITKGSRDLGGMKFNIEHADEKGIVHTVGRRRGDLI